MWMVDITSWISTHMNKDHFKVFNFGLDKAQFLKDARRIQNKINKNYADIDEQAKYPTYQNYQKVLSEQLEGAPMSTKLHDYYNIFTFQYASIHNLYKECVDAFKQVCDYQDRYMYWVHGWLNYQSKGESIPPHFHWKKLSGMDHCYIGTYYINAEPSVTTYKFDNGYTEARQNENDTYVIYEDVGDIHGSDVWQQDEHRIGITMEFVPMQNLQISPFPLNTWMPVV